MFLRRYQRRKNGKPHSYWALVESYRTAKGSRQRVIAYLGELAAKEQDGWSKLGLHLDGNAPPRCLQRSLFDPPQQDAPQEDEPLLVRLSSIRFERTRDFGDVWLAWGLWRMLGLDEFFEQRIERGREDVSWGTMAAILTIARFCEPASELHIADTWYRRWQGQAYALGDGRVRLTLCTIRMSYFTLERRIGILVVCHAHRASISPTQFTTSPAAATAAQISS